MNPDNMTGDNDGVKGELGKSTCHHQGDNVEGGGEIESRPERRKELGKTGEKRPSTREESVTMMLEESQPKHELIIEPTNSENQGSSEETMSVDSSHHEEKVGDETSQ
ncbi:hypothetical protein JTB14_002076 [Gonioctena quinquepunctata]|nr:hypothetical protein JTB14_002076 [Gonioctena quinquepunctata]